MGEYGMYGAWSMWTILHIPHIVYMYMTVNVDCFLLPLAILML